MQTESAVIIDVTLNCESLAELPRARNATKRFGRCFHVRQGVSSHNQTATENTH
jgi:hypothetical protein